MITRREFIKLLAMAGPAASLLLQEREVVKAQGPTPPPYLKKGRITPADRKLAGANRAKAYRTAGRKITINTKAAAPRVGRAPLAAPDYFGTIPNYASSPLPASVSIWGDGIGATATLTIDPGTGAITAVTPVTPGSGYTTAFVYILGGGGTGASITANIVTGAITSYTVTAGGTGYNSVKPMRKFVDPLPGLYISGTSPAPAPGTKYIPVAVPDTTTYNGSDYYEIELGDFTEQMHSDLPATTKVRGYRQTNCSDPNVTVFSYLGPVIIAQKDRPVRVKFTNNLHATGAGGDLFIPVDTTAMGAGAGPSGGTYSQNRATLHLHGGNTPWISDGTPHQWTTPAVESTPYAKGVSVQNVPDMPPAGPGQLTFFYTNQQSARLMFYHDHAYGITRLNVYAGEAAGYIVRDPVEMDFVNGTNVSGVNTGLATLIPADEIPLIIQDKTFVPSDPQRIAQDPTWDVGTYGGYGNFWFPHVYMPNQNPWDMSGANANGRWDYGPWFWPPSTQLVNQPIPNPLYPGTPGEPPYIPATPNPSLVPEGFMDTPVVNGAAYPYIQVKQQAYRFRILNACNDRMLNLQLYTAGATGAMWNLDGTLLNGLAGEVPMVPATPNSGLPATWPTDGRDGGVPNPANVGPTWIVIGNEAGFIPAPALVPPTPVGYDYNRRSIVVLNVLNRCLFLGPAERADVIVDFSGVPVGTNVILYNDAPAPVPAFDPRNDYYTGCPDQTSTGGTPPTQLGYGPNTRTIMQIQVTAAGTTSFNLGALQAAWPAIYAKYQAAPLVPQASYNAAFGQSAPVDAYARIQSTSMTFFNGPLTAITLTNGGSGYLTPPAITIAAPGGGGVQATATAIVSHPVASLSLTAGGSGYTTPPAVAITGGGGTGATATATLSPRPVGGINVTNGGNGGYVSTPTVTITGGGGTGATAVAVIKNRRVAAINLTSGGSGYTSLPTVTITGGGGSGATAVAVLAPGSVASLAVTNGGSGYTTIPVVSFSGGGGSGAAATAVLGPGTVTSINLTNAGTNYTSQPGVSFNNTGTGGSGAAAVAVGITMPCQPKAIQELFTLDYGRMNATLGVEIPNSSINTQTTIPMGYIDPPTELIKDSVTSAPIGSTSDGTQIWKITHNGVDTHAIHFHLFNVQLINRVGWDGAVRPPLPQELGWKETVIMNPLEDCIVALRALSQTLPTTGNWAGGLPNSIRPMDVTMPLGTSAQFTNIDPTNQPATAVNSNVNFGYEYVWHCHLLGHEENDMMRPMLFGVAPAAPSAPLATLMGSGNSQTVNLTWTDNARNETGFTVQRATTPTGPWTVVNKAPVPAAAGVGSAVNYTDAAPPRKATLYYRVIANNVIGYTQAYAAPAVGYPSMSVDSVPSGNSNPITTN